MRRDRVWKDVVPETDEAVYEALGFGRPGSVGGRPAVLVIDVQQRTVNERYPASCGAAAAKAVPSIRKVVDAAREANVPVIFPSVAPKDSNDSSRFAVKMSALQTVDLAGYDYIDELRPRPGDIIVPKRHPSAFFGTALVSYLIDRSIDSLVICGATTSGCVRATACDAFAYGYRVAVPYDCVFDRVEISHYVNLFDINYKYGDVCSGDEIVQYLGSRSVEGGAR